VFLLSKTQRRGEPGAGCEPGPFFMKNNRDYFKKLVNQTVGKMTKPEPISSILKDTDPVESKKYLTRAVYGILQTGLFSNEEKLAAILSIIETYEDMKAFERRYEP
jgi:hypothetical protein